MASDRRHDFRANGSYELPFGPGRTLLGTSHGPLARLVEQWQMSWILNLTSGGPIDITGTNTYFGGSLVDVVGNFPKNVGNAQMTGSLPSFFAPGQFQIVDDPQCAAVTTLQATKTSCTNKAIADASGHIILQNAQPGKRGNLGQSWVTGPGTFRFDLSAAKTVKISESKSLQFRLDAKSVLNHPILGTPDLNINSATFGQFQPTIAPPGAVGAVQNVTGARQFQAQLRVNF
jgi:hypothetical protein